MERGEGKRREEKRNDFHFSASTKENDLEKEKESARHQRTLSGTVTGEKERKGIEKDEESRSNRGTLSFHPFLSLSFSFSLSASVSISSANVNRSRD